jgi:uncharacterized protein YjgD (DUF1641 family)
MTVVDVDAAVMERLDRLSLQMTEISEELDRQREMRDMLVSLTEIAGPVMDMVTSKATDLERKGYFTFAQGGLDIADRVVTSFSEEDIQALGDNVVLILNTVKEMTQPEVMHLLSRTAIEVQEIEDAPPSAPPSTFALLSQMRDPEVRRGLARTLNVLRSLGRQAPNTTSPKE